MALGWDSYFARESAERGAKDGVCAVLWEKGEREGRREQTAGDQNLEHRPISLSPLATFIGVHAWFSLSMESKKKRLPKRVVFHKGHNVLVSSPCVCLCTLCVVFVLFVCLCAYKQTAS